MAYTTVDIATTPENTICKVSFIILVFKIEVSF